MAENFRATNKLARYLNKEANTNISEIRVDSSKTLKQNADVLVQQVHKIQEFVKKIDEKLKEELEPDLYEKITNVDTSFEDRIRIAQNVMHVFAGIAGVTVACVVGKLVAKELVERVASRIAKIAAASVAGAIAGGIAGLAVDVIAGAIAGAYEKRDLEAAIKELEKEIDAFLPASEDYTDTVYEVLAEVRVWERHHGRTKN